MRILFIVLIFWLVPISLVAQNHNATKLKKQLKEATTDSARYAIDALLADYYTELYRDSTIYYVDQGIRLAKKNDKKIEEADLLNTKGYVFMHLGKYAESLQCYLSAFKIAEDPANENKTWFTSKEYSQHQFRIHILLNIHHHMGHLMGNTNNPNKQIFHYNQTHKLAEELKDTVTLGFVNMNLGKVYLNQGKLDIALKMENEAAQIFKKAKNYKYLGNVYTSIGKIYEKKGNGSQAINYFRQAMTMAKKQNNFTNLQTCYNALAQFYLNQKKQDSALVYARKQLAVAQIMKEKNLGSLYTIMHQAFDLSNNIDSAYKYQKLAIKFNDSTSIAKIKNLTNFQSLSFKEQQRLQELEQDKIAGQTKLKLYGSLFALAILGLIASILYLTNKQKLKANRELESTLSDLKTTQAQLIQAEKMASLGELTAGIAHEIQNPLNFVNNFSDLSMELIDEMLEEYKKGAAEEATVIAKDIKLNLGKINQHGKRADGIVKGMLAHSRTSSGQKELTDINALADEYLKLTYHGLRAKDKSFNAEMKTDFEQSLPKIAIVPQDFGRVLLNLINNAFYAVNEKSQQQNEGYKPTVTISTKSMNGKVEITIADNGNGIPQSIIDKIFQPFFTTKPTGQGTGLGLSLSYDTVKAHGGELKLETKHALAGWEGDGQGTTFTIKLPITSSQRNEI